MVGVLGAKKIVKDTTKEFLRSVIADLEQQLYRANRKIIKYKELLEQERAKKEAISSYSGDVYYTGISRAVEVLDNAVNDRIAVQEASSVLRKTIKAVAEVKIKGNYKGSRRNEDAA
jgi:hypothetical protein